MSAKPRRARVRALAKINLDLRVLAKRPDGFHELRTIFQTISLADTIDIAFTPGPRTGIAFEDTWSIPGNLAARAAKLLMETLGATGRIEMRLAKRIPMGAGLGGGSSDAAAVLLALPALAGLRPSLATLCQMGQQLGSDVPFFLLGGTAVGIGRGTELFPLPDPAVRHGLLVAPEVHVSTAEAYQQLSEHLGAPGEKILDFQAHAWNPAIPGENDFETVVFLQHRRLAALKNRLLSAGASSAMMTGSGSSLFGLFRDRPSASAARRSIEDEKTFPISFVSRARYRSMWWRALEPHVSPGIWPPASRHPVR